MRFYATLPLMLAFLTGCTSQQTPSEIYEEYNSRVSDGISFPDDQAYFSKRKIDEIEAKLPQYMKQMR